MKRSTRWALNATLTTACSVVVVACGGGSDTSGTGIKEDLIGPASTTKETRADGGSSKNLASCPCTIWPTTAAPRVAADSDTGSVNLGVQFTTEVDGYVTGVRFYKGAGNDGTHVGSLWSDSGQLLARATFTGETATGWQTATFSTPVAITAGKSYTASYLAPAGRYAVDENYFNQAFVASPLRAVAGVYKYGASNSFPTSRWRDSNYWVDVVFSATPASAPATSQATLAWSPSSSSAVTGYRVYYGTAPGAYLQQRGAGIPTGSSAGYTVSGLAVGARYYFSVTSIDGAGNESPFSNEASKLIQ